MSLDTLIGEAKELGILHPIRSIDVHCPDCGTRLHANGECPACGLVGSSEEQLRKLQPSIATSLLERSIARRRSWKPEKKAAAKSQER